MSIPDLPTVPEVSAQSKSGLKYHILGTIQQTLAIELQADQTVYSDTGAMSWMTSTVNMNTTSKGGLGGLLKRAVAGGTAFIIEFIAQGAPGQVAFTTDFPGKILPVELENAQSIIMHKHAFLCAEKTVGLGVFFTRKLGAGKGRPYTLLKTISIEITTNEKMMNLLFTEIDRRPHEPNRECLIV